MPSNRLINHVVILCGALLGWGYSAQAQTDLTGSWLNWTDQDRMIRAPGPDLYMYLGLPINEAARQAALAYVPENIAEVHRQCALWPMHYIMNGPWAPLIWPTRRLDGSVLAWNIGGSSDLPPATVWMDGRPHPGPQAATTMSGFTTGVWQGNTLVTTTTHIHDGYLYRNGVPNSNQEVFTMFITRHDDDTLTITGIVRDPVYLTASYVQSAVFSYRPLTAPAGPGGGSNNAMGATCTPAEEGSNTLNGQVPSYLTPSPELMLFATEKYGIPQAAAMGGERTMYPEYAKEIRDQFKRPSEYCTYECCNNQGPGGPGAMRFNVEVLQCAQTLP